MELDWQKQSLEELCSIRREAVKPSSKEINRYIGLEHIDSGIPYVRRWGTDEGLRSSKNRFHKDDVLYGKLRPYLDKAVLAEWNGVCSTDILALQPKKDKADSEYLTYLLHTSDFLNHAISTTSGVNHPRTSWISLSRFSYLIPTLSEQKAIVVILSKIQDAIELQEKVIVKLRELKAATMDKLFCEGLRGEPLKQTEIGEIPATWTLRTIVSLGDLVTGTTPPTKKPEHYGGEVPFISPGDIGQGRIIRRIEKSLSQEGVAVSRPLPSRAVLVVCIGSTIGKVGMTNAQISCTNQQINAIICNENVYPEFVYYLMAWNTDRIRNLSTPSPVPILNKAVFGKGIVALPVDQQEQKKIANVLCAIDDRIEIAEKKHEECKLLFSSMLHLLMTGKIRINGINKKNN